MKIDFHTHIFPDKIAHKTLEHLTEKAGGIIPNTDATISGTKEKMKAWGIDKFVMLSIATNPRQQTNVNNFAIEANGDEDIFAFGSVHPDSPDALSELDRIHAAGLPGVKFHPEYQQVYIDDKKMYPLYEKCANLGLVMSFHTGIDIGYPDTLHAHPKNCLKFAKDFEGAKIVFAHMGGFGLQDEVLEYLIGCGAYFDTSFSAAFDKSKIEKIIKLHGASRILFASDCPWSNPEKEAELIDSMDLTEEEKDMIFYKNAEKLLTKGM